MNLKSQVTAHLRNGSINVPGRDAVDVLASRLDSKKNEVRNVLVELLAEGTLDLAGGTVRNTSFIALRQEFRPRTEQGRKESKYAVDQRGNHYRGTATGGPLITRQATLEEWVRMGNDASTYTFGTPANEIQVQEATIMDASVPKSADAVSDEAQAQAAAPVVDAVNAEPAKPSGDQPKRKRKAPSVPNPRSVNRLTKVEELKAFIMAEAEKCAEGLIPSEAFRLLAAKELGVSLPTISNYLRVLTDSSFVEYTRNGVQHGTVYIRLVVKQSSQEKLSAALEVLRTLKRKRSRKSLTDELAVALRITPKSAQTSVLSCLRVISAYKVEQVGNEFVLKYVQDGPVTDEQMEKIRLWRREHYKGKQPEQVDTETAPQATAELDLPMQQPDVVLTEPGPDEITLLVSSLVEANEALQAEVARLKEHNEFMINQVMEVSLEREHWYTVAEAERTRPIVVTPAKPTLPEDLLQRARAALVTQVRNHLRPPAEGDDIV